MKKLMGSALIFCILLVAGCGTSNDAKKEAKKESTDVDVASLSAAEVATYYKDLEKQFSTKLDGLKKKNASNESLDRAALALEIRRLPAGFGQKFFEIASNHPDTPQAAESLLWILQNNNEEMHHPGAGNIFRLAKKNLFEKYPDAKNIGSVVHTLAEGMPSKELESTLNGIIEKIASRRCEGNRDDGSNKLL